MEAFGYWKFPLIHHVGFHLGGGLVIDNAPGTGISLRCLQGFDHSWSLGDLQPTIRTLQRAASRLGEKAYCPLLNNCQDFVTWCSTGRATSWQAGLGIVGGSTLVGAVVGGPCGAGLGAAIGSLLALVRDLIANLKAATRSLPIRLPSLTLLGSCPSWETPRVGSSVRTACIPLPHVSRIETRRERATNVLSTPFGEHDPIAHERAMRALSTPIGDSTPTAPANLGGYPLRLFVNS